MKLNLTRPIVFFDLETTGLSITKDRIIQISYIKVLPDGTEIRREQMLNPLQPIPEVVVELTGITNEMVASKPSFADVAEELVAEFSGCDFAGYNSNRFDFPLLVEEFYRARVNFDYREARLIDVQNIFHKMERRNLAAAYKLYCGRNMEDDFRAHRADEDTEATYRVLQGQLDYYSSANQENPERQLQNDVDALSSFSKMGDNVDLAGTIVWKEVKDAAGNEQLTEVFNIGKHRGKPVSEVLKYDPSYYTWVMSADFTNDTRQVLTELYYKYVGR